MPQRDLVAAILKKYPGVDSLLEQSNQAQKNKVGLVFRKFAADLKWQLEIHNFLSDAENALKSPDILQRIKRLSGVFLELFRYKTEEEKRRTEDLESAYAVRTDTTGTLCTLKFVASFLYLYYITFFDASDRRSYDFLATFIITIYNLEAVGTDGRPKSERSKDPSAPLNARVAPVDKMPSVFHNHHKMKKKSISIPDGYRVRASLFYQVDYLNAENRDKVTTRLLRSVGRILREMEEPILICYTKTLMKMLMRGYDRNKLRIHETGGRSTASEIRADSKAYRIHIAEASLLECIHTAMVLINHSDYKTMGQELLRLVHFRGMLNGFPKVLLVHNAINHYQSCIREFQLPKPSAFDPNIIRMEDYVTKVLDEDIPKVAKGSGGNESDKEMQKQMKAAMKAEKLEPKNVLDLTKSLSVPGTAPAST